MFENLFSFVDRAVQERDWLMRAVNEDKRDAKYQAKITAWNNGRFPLGRTGRLLARLCPNAGYSRLDQAYQAAINEAVQAGLGPHLLPKLEAARRAHEGLLANARSAYESSVGTESFRSFTDHCEVITALAALLAGQSDAKPGEVNEQNKPDDDSSWVIASTLWKERFTTIKEVTKFRERHPNMFRNPSKFKLEIHAGLWSRHWADRDKAGFETLDGELPSVADDPNIQDEALAAAAQRMAAIRQKKQSGKR